MIWDFVIFNFWDFLNRAYMVPKAMNPYCKYFIAFIDSFIMNIIDLLTLINQYSIYLI